MARKRRDDQVAATRQLILDTARRLMAEQGTAGLSIRVIARELNLTAPALYYYFDSLDDLITALILDAFNALACALETSGAATTTPVQKVTAAWQAYRTWALAHPGDFQLLFGNPIPGYVAPVELTVPAAQRSYDYLHEVARMALDAGVWRPRPPYEPVSQMMRAHLLGMVGAAQMDENRVRAMVYTAVIWPYAHGLISLELAGFQQSIVDDTGRFYTEQVGNLLAGLGLVSDDTL